MERLAVIIVCLLGLITVLEAKENDHYEVIGVTCGANEEVSCLMVNCPAGRYCPAEQYCFDPECVCRRGYRRSKGVCVPKHPTLNIKADDLDAALLDTYFGKDSL